jgi:hypothetical protein
MSHVCAAVTLAGLFCGSAPLTLPDLRQPSRRFERLVRHATTIRAGGIVVL